MTDTHLFPAVGWELKYIDQYDTLIIRFPFLSSPMQKLEEADPGRWYALQPQQARELAERILAQLDAPRTGQTPPLNG